MEKKNIILIQLWIGPIPDYFWYHYETTKNMSGIDFLFVTDQTDLVLDAKNYSVIFVTKDTVENLLKVKTGKDIKILQNKKICDLKASLGDLFKYEINNYKYFGFYDIDTLFGDFSLLEKHINENYDVISIANTTFHNRVGGPFTIIKNTEELRKHYIHEDFYCCFENENVTCYEEHDWYERLKNNYSIKIIDSMNIESDNGGKITYDVIWSGGKLNINNEEKMLYHFYRKKHTVFNKVGNQIFGKFNKKFIDDFYWVFGFTENYSENIEYVLDSIKKYSNRKCVVYPINFDYNIPKKFLTSEQFLFRKINIEEGKKDSKGRDENIISCKPKIMIDVINTFSDKKFVFIDSDVYLTTSADDVSKYFTQLENYPLINSHIHDRLYLCGIRENEEWTDTVSILAEAAKIDICVYPRRKTNIMVFDKKSKWFFEEQISLYETYKDTEPGIFVLHDEDSANVVLSKYNLQKSLHLCDIEECDNLEMSKFTDTNHPFHMTGISEFVILPTHQNDIVFFHGLKDKNRYINIQNEYGNSVIDCEELLVQYNDSTIYFERNSFLTTKQNIEIVDFVLKDKNGNVLHKLLNQNLMGYWTFFISNVNLYKGKYIVEIFNSDNQIKIYNNILEVN